MAAALTQKKNTVYYINSVIVICLFLFVKYLPPFGAVTEMGMAVLGVFVGMLYGWLTVGFAWPSILGLVFLGLTGATTINAAFSSGWGNINAVILVIMGFALAAYLDACDLTTAIAAFFLTRKFINGRPWVLICMIYLASFVLGAFVNLFAGIFVMWAILYKIMDLVGYEKRTLRSAYLLGMVGFVAQIGMIYLPFHSSGLMYVGFLTATTGLTIAFGKYIVYQTFCALVVMLGYAAVGKFILRLDFSAMADSKNFEYLGGRKLTFEQKFGLFDLVLLIVILLAPDFLPETSGIYVLLKTLGVAGAFAVAMAIPAMLKNKEGKPLMDIAACTKSTSWDVVWLLVATMPIATVMQSEDCGIVKTVVAAVIGVCGDMHWILFTILTTVVLGLATQVTHNLILAVVLFGPLALVCQQLGGNPVVWFMINYWVNMAAFVTPAGSATSAIVHGNSEWLKPKDAYLVGTLWLFLNIVLCTLVGVTIGTILF